MDVRCEKCQTEYELDEARLKPSGVTVKCTHCGHMFKIRKRTVTNVGTPVVAHEAARARSGSKQPVGGASSSSPAATSSASSGSLAMLGKGRQDPMFEDDARPPAGDDAPTTVERQWLIRLENGDQKSCRELATLQQWIISRVVTRESLISRTGKTWKRLGDIADLGQYFTIADEARANRDRHRPGSRPAPVKEVPGTIPGYSAAAIPGYSGAAQAAGGTILPDDDDDDLAERRTTRSFPQRAGAITPPPVPVRGTSRTPPLGSNVIAPPVPDSAVTPYQLPKHRPSANPLPPPPITAPPPPTPTPPPPLPPRRQAGAGPTPPPAAQPPAIPPPQGNRATAMWATDGVAPNQSGLPPSGPFVGKLAAIPDEPAFAGRVRMAPGDEATFDTGKVPALDDDDDVLPARRGSRVGMLVLVMALLVMGAGAAVVYVFVIRKAHEAPLATAARDAGAIATVTPDAAVVAPVPVPVIDAAPTVSPLDAARGELAADVEPRLRVTIQALDGKPDAPSQALRAYLIVQLAQDLQDRASVTPDKPLADALRKEAKQLVLDAATAAQRALQAAGDDAGANLAMAEVLRLQGKPARDSQRYLETARAKADKDWTRDLALAAGLGLVRDGKLDAARAAFTAIDQGDGKLETSGDVRARFHLALTLAAQNKAAEAKPLVETILAAQPEHAGAKALAVRLETLVEKTDPLPPEDGTGTREATPGKDAGTGKANPTGPGPGPGAETGGGESYDRLLKRADAVADTSCTKAMELYAKALEQKPNGVEALTGMGYCHIDAKQFPAAFSKFRAALAVSSRYEPALRGVAEAYQQQGRKDQAIEAYRAYLEVYPDRAAAKKQLEILGGGTAATPPAGNGAGSAPAPAPTPPTPAPTPALTTPEPSGAGSGSG
jgi:predicted Zn finger-like uncharacterized protein